MSSKRCNNEINLLLVVKPVTLFCQSSRIKAPVDWFKIFMASSLYVLHVNVNFVKTKAFIPMHCVQTSACSSTQAR